MYLESGYSVKLEIKNLEEVKHCEEIEDLRLKITESGVGVLEVMGEVEVIEKNWRKCGKEESNSEKGSSQIR